MDGTQTGGSTLTAVSNAMVKLHKEQFGRGPTGARASFAGRDALICVLEDVLLPAELKIAELGDAARVRETRLSFQSATAGDFVAAVEQIVGRKVRAFGSSLDVDANVAFENFAFEAEPEATGNGDGVLDA